MNYVEGFCLKRKCAVKFVFHIFFEIFIKRKGVKIRNSLFALILKNIY